MTYKEALNRLRCGGARSIADALTREDYEATIAEALMKQIPKTPLLRTVTHPVYGANDRWCCPVCARPVEVDDNEYYQTEYYPACKCGQIIDWSFLFEDYEVKWNQYKVESLNIDCQWK